METLISVSLIQQMLAPGLMISACGLLLLGVNNKQVAAIGRIRNLEEEKRNFRRAARKEPLDDIQEERLLNLDYQLITYARRVIYFRNSVFFYTVAVALFVFASLAIGFQQLGDIDIFSSVALVSFMAGMLCTLGGAVFAAIEVWLAYRVITREIYH
ncbi:MAG: DUF2721 domain-containing protein [Bacteroidales bacterium]|nr:DUF2721 domain-containing protein [Bacteroidales bacterium]